MRVTAGLPDSTYHHRPRPFSLYLLIYHQFNIPRRFSSFALLFRPTILLSAVLVVLRSSKLDHTTYNSITILSLHTILMFFSYCSITLIPFNSLIKVLLSFLHYILVINNYFDVSLYLKRGPSCRDCNAKARPIEHPAFILYNHCISNVRIVTVLVFYDL